MVVMDTFHHLLHWKLKAGSHPFPGPDGGTCINEAALVAAGFKYRPIGDADQMPECFSRPICRLAMKLNDSADDKQRQRLLPYVTRLACADTPEVEAARAAYIRQHISSYGLIYGGHDLYAGMALPEDIPLSFDKGLEVLEGALAIGRQADPLGPDEVETRMEAMKAKATIPTSVQTVPFLSKVKSWLTMKETDLAI